MRSPPHRPDRKSAGNGAVARARVGALAMVDGAAAYDDEPMSRVLGLDEGTTGTGPWIGYILGAIALFLGLIVAARVAAVVLASFNPIDLAPALPPQEIEVVRDEPPPPPPPPPEIKKPAEPEAPPVAAKAPPHDTPPPAPSPAQAAKVLTQEPDPNEPVDLTGNTIVTGNAEAYAGGTTASNGTGTHAVRGVAVPQSAPAGTGTVAAPAAGPDRSRKASLAGIEWNGFPPEADALQIDEAYVTMQVDVRSDGTVAAVRILQDPGNGFGREAKKKALGQKIPAALDHDGNPIPQTITARVHFSR